MVQKLGREGMGRWPGGSRSCYGGAFVVRGVAELGNEAGREEEVHQVKRWGFGLKEKRRQKRRQ